MRLREPIFVAPLLVSATVLIHRSRWCEYVPNSPRDDEDFAVPILPVPAASRMAMIAGSARLSLTTICTCSFQRKIDLIFGAAIHFLVTLLATKSLYFTNGHADDTETAKGFLDLVENPRSDDALEQFHTLVFRSCG